MTSLENRWLTMPAHPAANAFQRIDDAHPLDFYLGRDVSGEWLLLLVTAEPASSSRETKAIHVLCRKRSDGKWAMVFRLMKPELGKLFALVCEDLIESSRSNPDPAHPASYVLSRFARWQRLLERGGSGLLDDSALRGLVGELLYLESVLMPEKGGGQAVAGWSGPSGADRDYCFPDREIEIKTVREGADRILVSSAEQLDLAGKPLELALVVLDDAPPGAVPEAFTVLDLVDRMKKALSPDQAALDLLESRLLDAGLVLREEYGERAFVFRRTRLFRVADGFPAIRRSELPAGIGKVSWELLVQSILPFEVSTSA